MMKNCTGALTESQQDTTIFIVSVLGLVSFVSCILVIVLLFYFKLHKNFIYRLAMYQVLSSMSVSIAHVFVISQGSYVQEYSESLYHGMCLGLAGLLTYIIWVKLLFTSFLTLHLFLVVVCLKKFEQLEVVYVLVSIVCPLLLFWIPFIGDHYGPAGTWCWIADRDSDSCTDDTVGIIEQLVLWYVPFNFFFVLCIVASVIATLVLIWRGVLKKHTAADEKQSLVNKRNKYMKAWLEVAPLLAYPVIFFIFNGIPAANRIYNAVSDQRNFMLFVGNALAIGLWGLCSSIVLLVQIIIARYLSKRRKKRSRTYRLQQTGLHEVNAFSDDFDSIMNFKMPIESEIEKLDNKEA